MYRLAVAPSVCTEQTLMARQSGNPGDFSILVEIMAVASGGARTMFAQVGWPRRQPRAQPALANGAGVRGLEAPLWDSTGTELSPPP